ncbi:MAG: AbrB family transcriptional regulator [Cyanobacteria bacterium SW_6_48_11]|jgi:AbrB family looped-hinge helix DNA binding protein|nr:MAG: AbrB family transcriptional regulator [Cyanobacteria bacterium QS_3_48_167]PSO89884.1 MAG: AbrB family transcriptional regulator [Cyanobacteria bacterium QS_6_48_18]PSP00300.1 MAG: AbrB family transcriptional regulator [Cyanobacteria bacterium SW_6_48_11]PSP23484.1 MAG: AbrB family transcriptional regulator [Cyanobacteria bacterium SW_8_48_13]
MASKEENTGAEPNTRHKPSVSETSKVGKRGVVVIPAQMRRRFGLEEGALVITEETEEGILIRPAVALPVEFYTLERKAEFLLSNAIEEEEYQQALKEVQQMGLDPDAIPHHRP